MKKGIHPDFSKVTVTCACGSSFETFSTSKEMKIEICSGCHPFFTGTQRFVDTAGRVEKFQAKLDAQKKVEAAKAQKTTQKKPALKGAPKKTSETAESSKSSKKPAEAKEEASGM
ncbi:50S ribosomal protein L31 [bacterium]|nr:50S ribosomal protein L31 [bacterium]